MLTFAVQPHFFMTIYPFQAILPNLERITITEKFFDDVRENYPDFLAKDFFYNDESPAIFIYEIKNTLGVFHGVIASLDVRDYDKGKIKKHEKTIFAKEKQQMDLLLERSAMVKPVLLTYPKSDDLSRFIYTYMADNQHFLKIDIDESQHQHRFWKVSDTTQIATLQTLFSEKIAMTYVADGHHRLASNVLLYHTMKEEKGTEEYHQMLCAFFASDELRIEAFNRVVANAPYDFLEKINTIATKSSTSQAIPKAKHEFSFFYKNEWHSYVWNDVVLADFQQKKKVVLDVDILNEKVLHDIFDIQDVRKDARISYVEGIKGKNALEKVCNNNTDSIAFSLFPVCIEDLIQVSDNEDIMPPKSTWFEPRMKNGMLVQGI